MMMTMSGHWQRRHLSEERASMRAYQVASEWKAPSIAQADVQSDGHTSTWP